MNYLFISAQKVRLAVKVMLKCSQNHYEGGKGSDPCHSFKNLKGVSVYQRLLMRYPAQKLGART